MGISLSGGDYQYNRFDAYEKALGEELTGARLDRAEAKKKVFMVVYLRLREYFIQLVRVG